MARSVRRGKDAGRLSSGPHFGEFCRSYCRHTMQVPDGPPIGSPFELEPFQQEFFDEALELEEIRERGKVIAVRRVYSKAGLIIPRKNGKTSVVGAFSLYMGGPWDGEYRPVVILAAGSRDQAGELFDQATAFISDPAGGSPELQAMFVPRQISITCPDVRGVIRRVAGDGKLNHSLNPHVVAADELHAWKTKRQRENWKALTTAQGARLDPMVLFLTTEGEDEDDELYDVLERVRNDPRTEVEVRSKAFTIYRNREAGLLIYRYGCAPDTPLSDLETIKAANPASWRTAERLAEDIADPLIDEDTKRRLYMGIRTAGMGRWISDERIEQASSAREIPDGVVLAIGADAAKTRDTTAIGWAWVDPTDGVCLVDTHVWSCRPGVACDTFVAGGRLDNNDARDYVLEVLLKRFNPRLVFYDERYFSDQAEDLSQAGFVCVEMHQGKPEMVAAWNEFYGELHTGPEPTLNLRAGQPGATLRSHIKAAKGKRNAAGDAWIVRKAELPIDGLAAVVMATYAARHFEDFMPRKRARLVSW